MNYYEGPRGAAQHLWPSLMDAFDALLRAGKHVVFTGHTSVKTTNNPHGANYDVEVPFVSEAIWLATHPFIQCVCHVGLKVEVEESENRSTRSKAVNDYVELYLSTSATFKGAKNKWGISAPVRAGNSAQSTYAALTNAAHLDPKTFLYK